MSHAAKIEFGDFQTPTELSRKICTFIRQTVTQVDAVLEPTCGIGSFLVSASSIFPDAKLLGWEINPVYVDAARTALEGLGVARRTSIQETDFFRCRWDQELEKVSGNILIIGNLPWVTNAGVSTVGGGNVPHKKNDQRLSGIAAITGKSNFDISEWMLNRLIQALEGKTATIAMLCKTGTARKVLKNNWLGANTLSQSRLYRIDAKKHFGAAVDACLLTATVGRSGPMEAEVFADIDSQRPIEVLGVIGRELVSDIRSYRQRRHLEGKCPYQWRSGIKHDCADIMELKAAPNGSFVNKLGVTTQLESSLVYPLLKCSDLANGRLVPDRWMLVPQSRVGEPTSVLATTSPLAWNYLHSHRSHFEARKSSIYQKQVAFAVFGVGDYSFAPWKVAVSGLHHSAKFCVVGPVNERPVVFDDTCYFISFQTSREAHAIASLLNSDPCQQFLSSILFADSKRPVTVDLLQRLNLQAMAKELGLEAEWNEFHPPFHELSASTHPLQRDLFLDSSHLP